MFAEGHCGGKQLASLPSQVGNQGPVALLIQGIRFGQECGALGDTQIDEAEHTNSDLPQNQGFYPYILR